MEIVLTVLSFALPVIYFILKRKALTPFSFRNITKSFNTALIVQLILAVLYIGLALYIDEVYYKGGGNKAYWTDIIIQVAIHFTIIGFYFYLPGLFFLNLIYFINSRLKNR